MRRRQLVAQDRRLTLTQPRGGWPKKASRVASDLTEDVVRELALPLGFVDVKVCAIDETWSGLRLVIRLRDR